MGCVRKAGPVGWGERVTRDEVIQVRAAWGEPTSTSGEWLGRMFRAGRHARYMPWSPEGRGPGSGAPH